MPKDVAKDSATAANRPAPVQHAKNEPVESRWAHAHGDAWVVADYSDGTYRCTQCRIVLVVPR